VVPALNLWRAGKFRYDFWGRSLVLQERFHLPNVGAPFGGPGSISPAQRDTLLRLGMQQRRTEHA